jgi:Rrf2 family protein
MISQTGVYALRAVVSLATNEGKPMTTASLAQVTKVPAGYLSKVMQQLTRGGMVYSRRGVGGGYTLKRAPSEISILEVLTAVGAAPERIRECPLGLSEHTKLCPLHRKLDDTTAHIEAASDSTSIQDLCGSDNIIRPLC